MIFFKVLVNLIIMSKFLYFKYTKTMKKKGLKARFFQAFQENNIPKKRPAQSNLKAHKAI